MQYRKLGRTGLKASVISMGTYQFGGTWSKTFSQEEVNHIIEAAFEEGINLIDTAECYGKHLAEKFVGRAIRGTRDKWIVATKFGHYRASPLENEQRWSAEEVKLQLEESLKTLETDYIDIYQFHSGSNEVFNNEELWSMLDKQKQAGKIRFLGVSLSRKKREWREYQTENAREVGADTIQIKYNRLVREAEEKVLPACRKNELGVLARVPLASGLLTGKYQQGHRFDSGDSRAKKYDGPLLDGMVAQVQKIKEEEVPGGVMLSQWALAWCLRHPAVSCVIPGCKSPEQVRQNARAASLVDPTHPLA